MKLFNGKIDFDEYLEEFNQATKLRTDGYLTGFKPRSIGDTIDQDIKKRIQNPMTNSITLPFAISDEISKRTMLLSSGAEALNQFGSKFLWDASEMKFSPALYRNIGVDVKDVDRGKFTVPKNLSFSKEAEWLEEGFGNDESDLELSEFDVVVPKTISMRLRFSKLADIFMGAPGVNFLIAAAILAIDSKLDQTIFYGTDADGQPAGLSENNDVQDIPAGLFTLL